MNMPIDDKRMLSALEALENVKKDLEDIAKANSGFEEKSEEIEKSIDDVFDRQKDIDKSIAKLETAIERLNESVERLTEVEAKIDALTKTIESLKPDQLQEIAEQLKEKVNSSLELYEDGIMHPKAKKAGSKSGAKSTIRKKAK